MVFFLAGLQNIEYSVYEAAKIDGASGWRTFWSITLVTYFQIDKCQYSNHDEYDNRHC